MIKYRVPPAHVVHICFHRCILKMDHHCPWYVLVHSYILAISVYMYMDSVSVSSVLQGQQLRWLLKLQVFCIVSDVHCAAVSVVQSIQSV